MFNLRSSCFMFNLRNSCFMFNLRSSGHPKNTANSIYGVSVNYLASEEFMRRQRVRGYAG